MTRWLADRKASPKHPGTRKYMAYAVIPYAVIPIMTVQPVKSVQLSLKSSSREISQVKSHPVEHPVSH